jgi:lysophospholipase L1-like esterase
MKLLAVGDSFTYGEELNNLNNAWPFLLGNKLDYEITNLAKPGAGNTKILRNTIENADRYDIIVVSWSHFARIELADEHGIYDIWPGNHGNLFKDKLSFRKDILNYINRHHDDVYLYSQQLINIILLQNYLKQNNKKYIMLDSFIECYNPESSREKMRLLMPQLVNQINSTYYLGWPNETMMEWTYGCSKGPGGHFLEQGHELVANKIYEYIRHLGWIS